jgi:copper chaperone CopZ
MSFLKMNIQSFEHPSHSQCQIEVIQKTVSTETLAQAKSIFLLVRGMGCPTCAACVRNRLLRLDDVFAVFISLEWGLVQVFYDPACVSLESLMHAVAKAGDTEQHHYTARILA